MYALLDNKVISDSKLNLLKNRGFKYGDGCFETIRVINGRLVNSELHYERLFKTVHVLKINFKQLTFYSFKEELDKLISMNEILNGARIRYTVFRDGDGFYTPDSNDARRLIEISPLSESSYRLNEKGLRCGICSDIKLNYHTYSAYKTLNALPYVMASIYKKESNLDNLILLNNEDRVVELCNSNIFLIKGKVVYTPPLSEGCIDGVFRKFLIQFLPSLGYKVVLDPIHIDAVSSADEIFTTNSISGIQWIGAIDKKRFLNSSIQYIFSQLILNIS